MTTLTHVLPTDLTRSLVSAWSVDMAIIKREKVDTERLDFLRNNPDVPKGVKSLLTAWSKLVKEGCWADIPYVLGKGVKVADEALGRMNAKGGVGLQSFPRDVRNALAQRVYWDIDISVAHPTLCRELCRRAGLPTTYQDELITNRNDKIAEIMDVKECSKETAKAVITALYFGEAIQYASLPEFYKQLWTEVDHARKVITQDEAWFEALRFLNGKKKNRLGSAFSYILQTIERSCLFAMEKSAKKNGRSLDTYIHDGGLIRKREGEEEFPESLLRAFEVDIEAETGFKLTLVSKPMETSYVFAIKDNSAYLEMKQKFEYEEGVFSIKFPVCFIRVFENKIQMHDTGNLIKNYRSWKIGDESFLTKWLDDPKKREYEGLVFLPGLTAPPNKFNVFMGWEVEPKQNDELMARFELVVANACNYNERDTKYMLDFMAHIIQRPYEKLGVAALVQGDKGDGKDTAWDYFGQMLGDTMFYTTGTPEQSVFSKFNGMLMKNLLVRIEEGAFATNKDNEPRMKNMITAKSIDIQQKNKDQINIQNFSRWVITSNEDCPIVITDDERRWFMVRASHKYRGDRAFWDETHAMLSRPEFSPALLYFMLNRDIGKEGLRDPPQTDYLKDAKQTFAGPLVNYLREWCERITAFEDNADPQFDERAFKVLEKVNEQVKFKWNYNKLSKQMKKQFDGVVDRVTRHGSTTYYTSSFSRIQTYLKTKGYWTE